MKLPSPHEDRLSAACVSLGDSVMLLAGQGWQEAAQTIHRCGELLLSGLLVLRYGLRYLYLADDALIPQMVYDDHRREHTGRELFAFVATRGHAYPRADVMGLRASGGEDHVLMRELDLAEPLVVIAGNLDRPHVAPVRVQVAVLISPDVDNWAPLSAGVLLQELPALLVEQVPSFRLNPARAGDLPTLLAVWLPAHS